MNLQRFISLDFILFSPVSDLHTSRVPGPEILIIAIPEGPFPEDKAKILPLCKDLVALDFEIVSTIGTHEFLKSNHIQSEVVKKVKEGSGNIVDLIKKSEIDILINTTSTKKEILESFSIRRTALIKQVPYFTTIAGAVAAINAIDYLKKGIISVKPLQEFTKIS